MNWLLVAVAISLSVFGVMAIYSATYMREEVYLTDMWRRQIVWLAIGIGIFFVAALIDYRAWLNHVSFPLIMYLGGLGFLGLTHFIGRTTFGAKSWLDIGPISFQPAQLAVISTLLLISWLLANTENWVGFWPTIGRIFSCAAIIAPPWILILIQPDLGECLVWIPAVLALLYIGRVPKRYLLVMIIIAIAVVPVVANFGLKPYQRERLTTFLNPDYDPQGAGWTINQSLIAIGSGGFYGKGFTAPNTQVQLGFLPSTIVHTDFIFAAIAEQLGFVGTITLVAAYGALLLAGLLIAASATDDLGRLVAVGFITLIFTHIYMNIGMTISITPITGVPLPLISYGGSFLVLTLFALGVLESIWIHRKIHTNSRSARHRAG
ncbi:MAG TPA: FtsW/RodA/SpoVE family cell cycle protein [Chthoniobacterales bacterium]|nr:FtsW/RodA/SpoVE family cell cycle protein [Chthoniobacterales bacterium]